MSEILTHLIRKEKIRQLVLSILGAAIIAILILSVSYGLQSLRTSPSNDGSDNTGSPDNGNQDNQTQKEIYILGLSSKLETEFQNDNIVRFFIHGNITSAVNPRLIYSEITQDQGKQGIWNAKSMVLNKTTFDPQTPYLETFNFTNQQLLVIHRSFVTALNNTVEVNRTEIPSGVGSVPNLLFYQVFFDDFTFLEFTWLGFTDVNIMQITHKTWSGTPENPQDGPYTEEHYISPYSEFDSFINQLQQLYSTVLD